MPSYNHERYIERAIDSILNQTYKDLELIIIDDGSKDGSRETINSYTDKRVIKFFQENKGAHSAINRGLNMAKGEYITILNSDDTFHKDRFKECFKIIDQNSDIDFISTWINVVDEFDESLGIKKAWLNMEPFYIANKDKTFAKTDNYVLNSLMSNFVSTTSNMIFKREVYEQVGGMRNLRFTHDWDFLLRVCENHNPYDLKKPLINYRVHGNNTISTHRKWMLFEICWIMAANLDRFEHLLLQTFDEEAFLENIELMLESFNFQGNEHVVRLLYWQISTLKHRGVINPEEIYLNNENIRNKIIEYINED